MTVPRVEDTDLASRQVFESSGMEGALVMAERLLVPLDGSALSEAALPWAEALARSHGFSLLLMTFT